MAESLHQDFFSCAFYALRKKYKNKLKLMSSDQASYFFEAFFIISIQLILCTCIIIYGDLKPKYNNNYALNFSMFFTNLVLHFSCLCTVRNGIQMCKYVVYHSDDFTNPIEVFLLALCVVATSIMVETCNALEALN